MDKELTLGTTIRLNRNEKKLTQAQLAEKSNISVDAIRNIERDKSQPRDSTIIKIEKALSVEKGTLLNIVSKKLVNGDLVKYSRKHPDFFPNSTISEVLSQSDLGSKIGVSKFRIQKMEEPGNNSVSQKEFQYLGELYGVDPLLLGFDFSHPLVTKKVKEVQKAANIEDKQLLSSEFKSVIKNTYESRCQQMEYQDLDNLSELLLSCGYNSQDIISNSDSFFSYHKKYYVYFSESECTAFLLPSNGLMLIALSKYFNTTVDTFFYDNNTRTLMHSPSEILEIIENYKFILSSDSLIKMTKKLKNEFPKKFQTLKHASSSHMLDVIQSCLSENYPEFELYFNDSTVTPSHQIDPNPLLIRKLSKQEIAKDCNMSVDYLNKLCAEGSTEAEYQFLLQQKENAEQYKRYNFNPNQEYLLNSIKMDCRELKAEMSQLLHKIEKIEKKLEIQHRYPFEEE